MEGLGRRCLEELEGDVRIEAVLVVMLCTEYDTGGDSVRYMSKRSRHSLLLLLCSCPISLD